MHDWGGVASDGLPAIFRRAEATIGSGSGWNKANERKDYQMKRARSDHDGRASNEGHGP
jgi:hypothetical protein